MSQLKCSQQQEPSNDQDPTKQKIGTMNEIGAQLVTGRHSHNHSLSPIVLNLQSLNNTANLSRSR